MSGLQVGAVVSITALGFRIPQRDLLLSRGNYCRGRSPPRPSLKTYNTSHRAPKEKRRNAVATLSVLKFNDPNGADRVLLALQGMQERQLITLEEGRVAPGPKDARSPRPASLVTWPVRARSVAHSGAFCSGCSSLYRCLGSPWARLWVRSVVPWPTWASTMTSSSRCARR